MTQKRKKSTNGKKEVKDPKPKAVKKKYEEENFVDTSKTVWNYSILTEDDVTNYQNGTHYTLYKKFGSHSIQVNDVWGVYFCVWAPNASSVSVKGNFNDWTNHTHELYPRWDKSGIWEGFIPGFKLGEVYKYHIIGYKKRSQDKGDPFANFWEKRPLTASISWDMYYDWQDKEWMKKRKKHNSLEAPWSVYEVHLASWQRPDKNDEESYNTYDQITERLFPYDAHGLFMFDGAHTYEYADMRKGFHPDWNSYIFNYKRGEVKSFLISSARFWFDMFHIDGIRVDAVSSMLKLNYSRTHGQWEPNEYGGDGNLEAIAFIKDLNETIFRDFPDVQTIAEEATDWPGVSKPTWNGGLGFGMKWMMGWMHDTLDYFKIDPIHRQHHQDKFAFSMMYYYDENFMLPLSHDEIVHGKSPMLYKMPGDEWQKFANLRLLYSYMWTHPGGKLLFMGDEFGQTTEWNYKSELDWFLLQHDGHRLLKDCVADLNKLLVTEPGLFQNQFIIDGFEWIDLNHRAESVICYKRKGKKKTDDILVVLNLTPVVRNDWDIYVNSKAFTKEIFNSDSTKYWGTGNVFNPDIRSELVDKDQKLYKLTLNLPPLAAIVLK